ncbi:MAG: hypothetical protein C0399_12060 [Syntrophus sp. (in: bacteria)]|nr:hypothetical protein [Syntrophus sp. (in: bacteria)]
MKSYKTIEKGANISRYIHIPPEFIGLDLEIEIRPAKKQRKGFAEFLSDSFIVDEYKHFNREELNER